MSAQVQAPGRLGDPHMNLETDPRTHPDMLQVAKALHMAQNVSAPYPEPSAPLSTLEPAIAAMEAAFQGLYEMVPNDLPGDLTEPALTTTTLTIPTPAGHTITLTTYRKASLAPPTQPGLIYFHGGGMTVLSTHNKVHERWCKTLAQHDLVVVLADFRNAWRAGEHLPFPAGLDDCVAATRYVHEHRSELGIGKLVLQGESGGANLSFAVAMRAKREGWGDVVAGVSGQVPYVSGGYGWAEERKARELPSLVECDGYLLAAGAMAAMARWYSPDDMENPLAWPLHAKEEDLKGLPPHHITVAELDPLKSEGMEYHRKLLKAGVRSTASVSLGLVHGASLFFRQALADEHNREARDIAAFAKSL